MLMLGVSDQALPLVSCECAKERKCATFSLLGQYQWMFCAHHFRGGRIYEQIRSEVILPIQFDKESDVLGSGTVSIVYKARIDPGHQCLLSVSLLALGDIEGG